MLSLLKKRWCLADTSPEVAVALARELGLPVAVAVLLINRGVTTAEEAAFFLDADLAKLHDPFLMAGMDKAVERVICAIESGESITVFCDYDVDGVTSAAFLTHFSAIFIVRSLPISRNGKRRVMGSTQMRFAKSANRVPV